MLEIKKRLQNLFERCDIVAIDEEYEEVIIDEDGNEFCILVYGVVSYNGYSYEEYKKQCVSIIELFSSIPDDKNEKYWKSIQIILQRLNSLFVYNQYTDSYSHLQERPIYIEKGFTNNESSNDYFILASKTLEYLLSQVEEQLFHIENYVYDGGDSLKKILDELFNDIPLSDDANAKEKLYKYLLLDTIETNTISVKFTVSNPTLKSLINLFIKWNFMKQDSWKNIGESSFFISKRNTLLRGTNFDSADIVNVKRIEYYDKEKAITLNDQISNIFNRHCKKIN
jgi:hypothetical protein